MVPEFEGKTVELYDTKKEKNHDYECPKVTTHFHQTILNNVRGKRKQREAGTISFSCGPNLFPQTGYRGGVEARPRSGRRHAVAETKMTGQTERDPLISWCSGKESVGFTG